MELSLWIIKYDSKFNSLISEENFIYEKEGNSVLSNDTSYKLE